MAETKKRVRTIDRLFVNEDGSVVSRATINVAHVAFKYADEKETRFDLAKIFGGKLPPPCVGRAAAAFGISTSAGNAGNTAAAADESDDPAIVREAVEERLEVFVPEDGSAGEWSGERAPGGPRTSYLLEAWTTYRQEMKAPVDDARIAKFHEDRKDRTKVNDWMKVPRFREIYEGIRAKSAPTKTAQEVSGLAD